jgi:hypothetical protein
MNIFNWFKRKNKRCSDCQWEVLRPAGNYFCEREDPLTGRTIGFIETCHDARNRIDSDCGESGIYWKPKESVILAELRKRGG